MEMEYGRPVEEVFTDITPEPLAAASLGQVMGRRGVRQAARVTCKFHSFFRAVCFRVVLPRPSDGTDPRVSARPLTVSESSSTFGVASGGCFRCTSSVGWLKLGRLIGCRRLGTCFPRSREARQNPRCVSPPRLCGEPQPLHTQSHWLFRFRSGELDRIAARSGPLRPQLIHATLPSTNAAPARPPAYNPKVYKATLRSNGKPVAVKVQRPGVLETVSLDLHLARELGYQMKKV